MVPRNHSIGLNNGALFICFSSTPALWTFNENKPLPTNTKAYVGRKQHHHHLEIFAATINNQGWYTCTGMDKDGIEFQDRGYMSIIGIKVKI